MTNKSYIPILAVLGAIMLVVVAAIAPPQSFLGHDFVHAQESDLTDNATLSDLTLSPADVLLSPLFDAEDEPDTRTFSARAVSVTNRVTVMAGPDNPDATVTISPRDQDSLEDGHQVLLTNGRNTVIRVTVRSEDRTETETYTITVYRERTQLSDNANLSALRLSGATLSPSFASAKTSYTGRATYSTEQFTLSYTADIGARVTIEGVNDTGDDGDATPIEDLDDDASGHQIDLNPGQVSSVAVVVAAENADEKVYIIRVYRENLVKSDNANLAASNTGDSEGGPGLIFRNSDNTEFVDQLTGFSATENTYETSYPNVRVTNLVRAVTVATNTADLGAVAVITPSDQDTEDTATGHQVLLSAGAKTNITVEVTAEDGTRKTYSVTIYRERRGVSSDADLSALRLSGVMLSPSFASDKTSYTGRVRYSTEQLTVSYTADIGAMVTIEPYNVDSGTGVVTSGGAAIDEDSDAPGYQVDLTAGEVRAIPVLVRAENGTTLKGYTVNVYRENLVKSDNASLADAATQDPEGGPGLVLSSTVVGATFTVAGTTDAFVYAHTTKSYDLQVTNPISVVTVATNTAEPGAVAVITPSDQDSLNGGHQVILGAGAKTAITVKVTAEDGTTTETYSITIYRERTQTSSDADLSALMLSGVTLSSAFASDKTSYIGRAPYSTGKTTVSYTADIGAMVTIEPYNVDSGTGVVTSGGAAIDEDSDAPGYQVDLTAGEVRAIPVLVRAENGTTLKGYTVSVYRENLPPSDNASLADADVAEAEGGPGLVLNGGGADNLDMDDEFEYSPDNKSYPDVRVDNSVQIVTVTANPMQAGAVAVITPSDQDSLNGGHQVILRSAAKNEITIEVTAEDGTTTDTYSVTIYRERLSPSSDAKLSALSLSGVALAPAFDPDKDEYIGSTTDTTEMTTVSYTADVGAMVEIDDGSADADADAAMSAAALADDDTATPGHQVLLSPEGQATVITVTVTPEVGEGDNGENNESYTITVYRDATDSSDATLQTLALSGITLSPAFSSGTTMYTAEAEDIESTMVEAMATHPGATVEGAGMRTLTVGENVISVTVTAEDETTEETYTVTVTVTSGRTLLEIYDANTNGQIETSELREAIGHYILGDIDTAQLREIITLYIRG